MPTIKTSFLFGMILILLSSCKSKEERLCSYNNLFCVSENMQHAEAKKLNIVQLYRADIAYYKVSHSGNSIVEDEIGNRGAGAIKALYEDNIIQEINENLLVSNIDYIDKKSGVNACDAPYYDRIMNHLTNNDISESGISASDRGKLVRRYCSSKSKSLASSE